MNKSKNDVRMTIALSKELREALKTWAENRGLKPAQAVRYLIEVALGEVLHDRRS